MTDFTTKLTNWLQQQPEYPLVFLADRPQRRRAARSLAKHILTLPSREASGTNRAETRSTVKAVGKSVGQMNAKLSKRSQRLRAKAERDRQRFARLSEARQEDLLRRRVAQALEGRAVQETEQGPA